MIRLLVNHGLSLREISRRTKLLSPTYLSQVQRGNAVISPVAYVLMDDVRNEDGNAQNKRQTPAP